MENERVNLSIFDLWVPSDDLEAPNLEVFSDKVDEKRFLNLLDHAIENFELRPYSPVEIEPKVKSKHKGKDFETELKKRNAEIKELKDSIKKLEKELKQKDKEISNLNDQIKKEQTSAQNLKNAVQQIINIENTCHTLVNIIAQSSPKQAAKKIRLASSQILSKCDKNCN